MPRRLSWWHSGCWWYKAMGVLIALFGAGSGGMALAAGLAISARLQRHANGAVAATLVNFVVGLSILSTFLALGIGGGFAFGDMTEAPAWAFLGGSCGAAYVTLSLVAVSRVGLAAATIAIVLGQIGFSIVIDYFGLFGIESRPIGVTEILGAVLLAASVLLTRLGDKGEEVDSAAVTLRTKGGDV